MLPNILSSDSVKKPRIFKMESKGYQANAPAPDPYGQPPSYEQASYPPPSQAYPPMGQAYPPPSQPYPPQSQGT